MVYGKPNDLVFKSLLPYAIINQLNINQKSYRKRKKSIKKHLILLSTYEDAGLKKVDINGKRY